MFWTDAGISPKVQSAWMDGTKVKTVIPDKLNYPTGIAIDYESADHRLYWSDSKLNIIESSQQDGKDRVTVLRRNLNHPISIDLFEDQIYWITRDTGEVFRQDKFGRGVKVRVERSLEQASDIKLYQDKKYNTSSMINKLLPNLNTLLTYSSPLNLLTVSNPCKTAACSHLCVIIPRGYRCLCPDGSQPPSNANGHCSAGFENPRAEPHRCLCKNGGLCDREDANLCKCPTNFEGMYCEARVDKIPLTGPSGFFANIILPILLVVIALVLASGLFLFFKKRNL